MCSISHRKTPIFHSEIRGLSTLRDSLRQRFISRVLYNQHHQMMVTSKGKKHKRHFVIKQKHTTVKQLYSNKDVKKFFLINS